jgi:type I restriction-modification system DNA methylase subunit
MNQSKNSSGKQQTNSEKTSITRWTPWNNEGSFLNDSHKDLKADFVIANPPFNESDWSGDLLRKGGRWKFGVPPSGNANYAGRTAYRTIHCL